MNVVSEILNKAADLIENSPKLAKGVYKVNVFDLDDNGQILIDSQYLKKPGNHACYCAEGAIREVISGGCDGYLYELSENESELDREVARRLLTYLCIPIRSEFSPSSQVFKWNDEPTRTKEQVVDALRGAANAVQEV